jgi:predicted NAD-dependent protein-ADP-ribosyltransferase YbiA (DUF1768 family)
MVLNANFGSQDEMERILSNFYPAPTRVLDQDEEITAPTVENLIQAIKFGYEDPRRQQALSLPPLRAKKLGQEAEGAYVFWDGSKIPFGTTEHHELIFEFLWAKFEQNVELRCRLVWTDHEEIVHHVGPPNPRTSLPNELFAEMLMDLRWEMREKYGFFP